MALGYMAGAEGADRREVHAYIWDRAINNNNNNNNNNELLLLFILNYYVLLLLFL